MSAFDDRQKTLENKFFHDEDLKFRIISRRRKLLGLWAAEKLHLGEEDSLRYALEIVQFGVQDNTEGAVVKRVMNDLTQGGIAITEAEVREKMEELGDEARRQFIPEE